MPSGPRWAPLHAGIDEFDSRRHGRALEHLHELLVLDVERVPRHDCRAGMRVLVKGRFSLGHERCDQIDAHHVIVAVVSIGPREIHVLAVQLLGKAIVKNFSRPPKKPNAQLPGWPGQGEESASRKTDILE
jgi:hypothetical protein